MTGTQKAETQTYTTSGNTISITKADGTTTTSEYCVSGDLVVSRELEKDGKKGPLFTLNRKK